MAKPILVIELPKLHRDKLNSSELEDLFKKVSEQVKEEYHVLIVFKDSISCPELKTLNDVSGLPDIDIKELIDEYTQKLG